MVSGTCEHLLYQKQYRKRRIKAYSLSTWQRLILPRSTMLAFNLQHLCFRNMKTRKIAEVHFLFCLLVELSSPSRKLFDLFRSLIYESRDWVRVCDTGWVWLCGVLGRVRNLMGSSGNQAEFDYLFKLLLIGDSGVGKSSLLLSFTSDTFEDLSPTIGVDFKVKLVTVRGKKLKLAIWDTAGQERFRTLTSSYYRGAQGVIMVYDVTRRETFTNLSDVWAKEVDLYITNQDCIKMLVGNKVDKESERIVSKKEGIDFARECGCLFLECSAKTRVNVEQCFEELVLKILDTPTLLAEGSSGVKKNIFKQKPPQHDASASSCC